MNAIQALKNNNTFEHIRSFDLRRWKINIYRLKKEYTKPFENNQNMTLSRSMDEQAVINSLR